MSREKIRAHLENVVTNKRQLLCTYWHPNTTCTYNKDAVVIFRDVVLLHYCASIDYCADCNLIIWIALREEVIVFAAHTYA